ncbi:MAG: Holliday junction resolvase-like protein [Nanoarchaeota archaeon]
MTLLFALFITLFALLMLLFYFYRRLSLVQGQLAQLQFEHRSQSVKHGQHWEQFVPFMHNFNDVANKDNFTFIGMPIDGICFDDDAVKFIEIKTGKGSLNKRQQQVKDHIAEKRVQWIELKY